jgi:hypothetical protein
MIRFDSSIFGGECSGVPPYANKIEGAKNYTCPVTFRK